jgi:glycosyltransferase involved in cell wall biosynthesis
MNSSELVSVVITTYNRSDALLAVLRGLTRQTDRNFEVVVADDGSTRPHVQTILDSPLSKALGLIHVWHPDVGFTAAKVRNRGVKAATGNYVIFLDGDCVPEVDFIARHRALAACAHFVNGSRILLSPAWTQRVVSGDEVISGRSVAYWLLRRIKGDSSKLLGGLRMKDASIRVQKDFSWRGIRSCNFAVWRSDFEAIDGFDESFVGWGHEDADFVLRLHHAGVARKNGYFATEVFHLWHPEASRNKESQNARIVKERAQTGIVRAALGYSRTRVNDDAVITRMQ